jgi:hypothetical protein
MPKLHIHHKKEIKEGVTAFRAAIVAGDFNRAYGAIKGVGPRTEVRRVMLRVCGVKTGGVDRWRRGGPSSMSYVEGTAIFHPAYKGGKSPMGLL